MANLKVNMSMTKNEMPEQDPVVRAGNFDEVALGYDAETAMKEAARCLDCKNSPCRSGCPVSVKIPRFLEKVMTSSPVPTLCLRSAAVCVPRRNSASPSASAA